MAELRSDLDLSIDDALGGIAEIEAQLDQVVESFSADLASALDQLSTLTAEVPPVEIDADTTPATEAIDALEADTPEIDADTAPATEAISSLGSEAGGASTEVASLESSTAALDATSAAAQGSLGGVASAIGGISKEAGTAVAAYAAIGGAATLFFNEAVEAQGQTERFQTSLGSLASSVENVNVGNLNTDLGDLAISLGSDDDALRGAAASMVQLGTASGGTRSEVAQTTEEVIALAARAVSLNPELGSVGDVAERMGRALSRGGRFAAQYGIDLSAAEIASRALSDTGKDSTDQLTFYEKAAAGAAIATEKYGDTLQGTIAEGQQNTIIVLNSLKQQISEVFEALGVPLVAPGLELLDSSRPAIEAAGRILQQLALAILPSVQAALLGVEPVLAAVASVLETLPAPIVGAATNWFLLNRAFGPTAGLIGAFLPLLTAIDPALTSAAVSIGLFAAGGAKLGGVLPGVSSGMGAAAGAGIGLGQAIGGAEGSMISFGSVGALIGTSIAPGIGTAVGAAGGALLGFGIDALSSGESAEEAAQKIRTLADEIDNLGEKRGLELFLQSLDFFDGANILDQIVTKLRQISEESPAAGQRIVAALNDSAVAAGFSEQEWERLNQAVQRGSSAYQTNTAAGKEAAATNDQIASSALSAGEAEVQFQEKVDATTQALGVQIPTLSGIFNTFRGSVAQAFDGAIPSVQGFVDNLQSTVTGIQTWSSNAQTIFSQGLSGLAQLVLSQGPVIGGQLAQEILAADPNLAAAWNQSILTSQNQLGELDASVTTLSSDVTRHALEQFNLIQPGMGNALTGTRNLVTGATPGMGSAGAGFGGAAAGGVASGTAPIPGIAGSAVQGAVGQVTGLGNPAYNAGALVGAQFGDGVAGGIASRSGTVASAARALVDIAMEAGRRQAAAASPSRRAAEEIGRPIGEGVEVGMLSTEDQIAAASARLVDAAMIDTEGARFTVRRIPNESLLSGQIVSELSRLRADTPGDGGAAPLIGTQIIQALDAREAATRVGRELVYTQKLVQAGRG